MVQSRVPNKTSPGPAGQLRPDPSTCSTKSRATVKFAAEPVIIFETSQNTVQRRCDTMSKQLYETLSGDQVTDEMLVEAAKLFNENYGKPVKLNVRRLREQYLPASADSLYTRVMVNGELAGNAFACRWKCGSKSVCWVTQLVVGQDYRERGLASGLLRSLRTDTDHIYGIMSSHPAACLAAAASFGTTIEKVSLDFIAQNAATVMSASPISYVHDAKLSGTLFDPADSTGIVSGVNTNFFVDHKEPLEALALVRESWDWPLGNLPDGHEYLLILPGKQRRSMSRSGPPPNDG
ncbi:hypothetical protein S40293_11535 [Stachybotrys chartarum IBT 40293]|nr:hypothetical protein S40293_11535 [Stachybotrys chartarum IBT 40293]